MYALMRIDYVVGDNGPIIVLWGRDKNGNLIEHKEVFIPRFYVEDENGEYKSVDGKLLRRVDVDLRPGESLKTKMEELRSLYKKTYESHIFLKNVFTIERNIMYGFDIIDGKAVGVENNVYVKPRVVYLDIETANEPGTWDISTGVFPIVAVSLFDNYTNIVSAYVWHKTYQDSSEIKEIEVNKVKYKVVIYRFGDERRMLEKILDYIETTSPDIITGWFAVGYFDSMYHKWRPGFDLLCIVNRCKVLGINYRRLSPLRIVAVTPENQVIIKGRSLVDLMELYKDIQKPIHELPEWSLPYVAKYVLGLKLVSRKPWIKELWLKKPDIVLQYNVLDTIATALIDKTAGIIDEFDRRRQIMGVTFDDIMSHYRFGYLMLLRQAHKMGVVFPDKFAIETVDKIRGAYVKEPTRGVKKWVAEFDFRTMYPTIIKNFNLSPECISLFPVDGAHKITVSYVVRNKSITRDIWVRTDIKGVLAQLVETLIAERLKTKAKIKSATTEEERERYYMLDRSFKFCINSIYGIMGSKGFPLFHPFVAAAITAVARDLVMHIEDVLTKQGYSVHYCDTDGIYVGLKSGGIEEAKELEKFIKAETTEYVKNKYNTTPPEVELRTVFESIFFRQLGKEEKAAKKGFAGKIVWEGKETTRYEVKGFPAIKSVYPPYSHKIQRAVLEAILDGKSADEIVRIVGSAINRFRNEKDIDEISFSKNINKDTYVKASACVRGWIWTCRTFDVKQTTTKVRYFYVKGLTNLPWTDVISYDTSTKKLIQENLDNICIDWDVMIDKAIRKPIEPYLNAIGIRWHGSGLPVYRRPYRKRVPKYDKKVIQQPLTAFTGGDMCVA